MNKKKTPEIIKKELLASIFEVFEEEEDYLHINEEGAEELRDSIFSKKVWRSFERRKQKDYKHSEKTGRVVKKIQG